MRLGEEIQYEVIEEYLISVINGPVGVYPDPPIALDKYPELTICKAQLAAFQSSMPFGSVCCVGDIVKGLKSLQEEWSLYPANEGHAVVPNNECSGGVFLFANEKD